MTWLNFFLLNKLVKTQLLSPKSPKAPAVNKAIYFGEADIINKIYL